MISLFPLSESVVGQRLRLIRIDGGQRLKRRLLALGVIEGGDLEVVQRRHGGVVVARDGTRVALGAGIAARLLAEVVE